MTEKDKQVYALSDRAELKEQIKWIVDGIRRSKRIKNFFLPVLKELDFRHHHIVASLFRGTPFNKIENYTKWKNGRRSAPDFAELKRLVAKYGRWHKYKQEILTHLEEVQKCVDSM